MPSRYLLAAPVLGIVWPSMAVALWWGAARAVLLAQTANASPERDGTLRPERRDDPASPPAH